MAKKATKKTSKKVKKSTKQISNQEFKIDPEFRKLLPPLTDEEEKALEASLIKEGLRERLLVWKETNTLIDGHNRYRLCKKHKIDYRIRLISFKDQDKEAVKLWIWENQEGRRNMTAFQRIEATLKLKDIIAKQAKQKQRDSGGAVRLKLDKPLHTYRMLGKRSGVSHGTVRKVERILEKEAEGVISSEVMDALRNGTVLHEGKVTIDRVHKQYCGKRLTNKKTKQHGQDMTERSDRFIKSLKMQLGRSFSKSEDCTSLYDQIIEWAKAQKVGIEEPSK